MSKIGFSPPDEDEEEEVTVQYGEIEVLEDDHEHLDSFWSSGYNVQLPRFLWAVILTLILGFASGILRVRVGCR